MIDIPSESKRLAIEKMQEIIDQAIVAHADAVTFEFAKEGGLEVLFVFGNTSVGNILVDLFRNVLLKDAAYVERVKRHYAIFRQKIDNKACPTVQGKKKRKQKKKKRKA